MTVRMVATTMPAANPAIDRLLNSWAMLPHRSAAFSQPELARAMRRPASDFMLSASGIRSRRVRLGPVRLAASCRREGALHPHGPTQDQISVPGLPEPDLNHTWGMWTRIEVPPCPRLKN